MHFKKHFYVCVYMFMSVGFMCIHTGAKNSPGVILRNAGHLFFSKVSSAWSPPSRLDWIATNPRDSCPHLPGARTASTLSMSHLPAPKIFLTIGCTTRSHTCFFFYEKLSILSKKEMEENLFWRKKINIKGVITHFSKTLVSLLS